MKTLSLLISFIIGICSIVVFRDRILDIASYTTSYLSYSSDNTTTAIDTAALNGTHLHATNMSVPRTIRKVFLAIEQAEGAGARVRRSIGTPNLRNFSPFLMLDHFSIKPGAGFPDQYVLLPSPPSR